MKKTGGKMPVQKTAEKKLKNKKTKGRVIKWGVVILAAFVVFRIITISMGKMKGEKEESAAIQAVPVTSVIVQKGEIRDMLYLNGDIKGISEVQVFSKVPGKLSKMVKKEGDFVKKGELLALVDRDTPGDYEKARIISPISGTVAKYFADIGGQVAPAAPLVYVARIDKVNVNVEIIGKEISKIKKGQEAEILLDEYPDRVFRGRVKTVSQWLNPKTRTATVRIEVDNPARLLIPGMYSRVNIVAGKNEDTIVLPSGAVLEREGEAIVFIIKESKAVFTKVETGMENEEYVEVLSGIKPGDEIVMKGNYSLINNARVEVEN